VPYRTRLKVDSYAVWFSIVARFTARVTVDGERVTAELDSLVLHHRAGTGDGRPLQVDSVTLGVAWGDSSWDVGETSAPVRIGRVLPPGASVRLGRMRLVIPHSPSPDEACQWIALTIHGTRPDANGRPGPVWWYAHSRRGVLVPARRASKCKWLR
jgi:hypothetical protein